ncbi:MAG: PEP-CTERM sorting domain-containing protein [Aquabacterium sp.]|nr:PEP-CTERM sorting domain-containing protein [Aquabacterium sp.]
MNTRILNRLACLVSLCTLSLASSLAQAGTYEELRFYTPGSDIPTRVGTPEDGPTLCTEPSHVGNVCAAGLLFDSVTAGTVTTYAGSNVSFDALSYQNLTPAFSGLGVATVNAQGLVSSDTSVDNGEDITLFFANQVEIVGFQFFDINHQAFAPASGATIKLVVDERTYTLPADNSSMLSFKGKEFTLFGGVNSYYLAAVRIAAIPEPTTWALMGLGLLGLGLARKRAGNQATQA